MRKLKLIAFLAVISLVAGASEADADGLLSRLRGNVQRATTPTQRYTTPSQVYPTQAYPTRNLDPNRSRLPAGRSYYQGRYYGNFNNRFYGPQYGYF